MQGGFGMVSHCGTKVRYAGVQVKFRIGDSILALLAIASFVTIFVVGILWATRPEHRDNSH